MAVSKRTEAPFALVVNDATQNLQALDLVTSKVQATEPSAEALQRAVDIRNSSANRGRRLFATGLVGWSFKGQAWLSCEGCHPDGLSDGVTWFFSRGPRRTISTAGTYDDSTPQRRRVMLWTGNIDEVHDVEAIVRGVAGGMGAILWDYTINEAITNDLRLLYDGNPVPPGEKSKTTSVLHNNLSGSVASLLNDKLLCSAKDEHCDTTPVNDWTDLDVYLRTVRAPRAPTQLFAAPWLDVVTEGKAVFERAKCAGCHGGPGFTLSRVFYTPGAENNGALPYLPPPATSIDMLPGWLGKATHGQLRRSGCHEGPQSSRQGRLGASAALEPRHDRSHHLHLRPRDFGERPDQLRSERRRNLSCPARDRYRVRRC